MRQSLVHFLLPLQTSKPVRGKIRWWQLVYSVGFFCCFTVLWFRNTKTEPDCAVLSMLSKQMGLVSIEIAQSWWLAEPVPGWLHLLSPAGAVPLHRKGLALLKLCPADYYKTIQQELGKNSGLGGFADTVNIVQP